MARDHGRVLCSIWRDEDFVKLHGDAQRLFMLILSQPRVSFCGVIDYTPSRWATLAAGITTEEVEASVAALEAARFVIVDRETSELLIRTFVRHDGVCESPNMIQAMWKAWAGVYSVCLRRAVVAELPDVALQNGFGAKQPKAGFEPPPEALAMRPERPSTSPPPPPHRKTSAKGSAKPSPKGSAKGSPKGSATPLLPPPNPTPPPPLRSAHESDDPSDPPDSDVAEEDDRLRQCWDHLAQRKLRHELTQGRGPTNERAWLAKVTATDRAERFDEAVALIAKYPTIRAHELAGALNGERELLKYLPRAVSS